MKILVTGIDGMVGHKIAQSLYQDFELIGSTRKNIQSINLGINNCRIVKHDFLTDNLNDLLFNTNPDIIINCVGITIRRGVDINIINTKYINTNLPHLINDWAINNKKKFIHFSSDCVFSGKKGNYNEESITDAQDTYGYTKSRGEVNNKHSLTIRCSIIGREVYNYTELFEWIYSMRNKQIEGFSNVMYSGVTSCWMGNLIKDILQKNINLHGIYNVSSNPISKYDLIKKISSIFNLNIDILPNKSIKSNKVLISKKFTEITGVNPPLWDEMLIDFKADCDKYSEIYKK